MTSNLSRRNFLKVTGGIAALSVLNGLGINLTGIALAAARLKTVGAREKTTICGFCSVGCGVIVHTSTSNGKVISIEGNPDHPINKGTLCSKGQALNELADNPRRLRSVLYRAPGSDRWEKKTWNWALEEIAKRMLKARDATFKLKDKKRVVVHRTEGIAQLGGATLDNEECYLLTKLARSLGIVYLDHQARI